MTPSGFPQSFGGHTTVTICVQVETAGEGAHVFVALQTMMFVLLQKLVVITFELRMPTGADTPLQA